MQLVPTRPGDPRPAPLTGPGVAGTVPKRLIGTVTCHIYELGQALPGDISEPLPQRWHLVGTDLRPDRDADLVWHRERPPHPGPTHWSTKPLSRRPDRATATPAADDLSTQPIPVA